MLDPQLIYPYSPIQGRGLKKSENYWTKLSPTFDKNLDLVPGLEKNNALKYCFAIFPTTLIYTFMLEYCRNNILM